MVTNMAVTSWRRGYALVVVNVSMDILRDLSFVQENVGQNEDQILLHVYVNNVEKHTMCDHIARIKRGFVLFVAMHLRQMQIGMKLK
jgi:hypothetical protein